jgi:hypothetical protein
MSGDESFLARWSRRKHETAKSKTRVRQVPRTDPLRTREEPDSEQTSSSAEPPPTLPPIESIEAASDVRAFLAPGVPSALVQAALRRAWATDPAIRDFIGLSENSWDFNAPDAMPGFGSLDVQEVRRLLEQIMPEDTPTVSAITSPAEALIPPTVEVAAVEEISAPTALIAPPRRQDAQQPPRPRHRHGSALPH